jgi:hypothetical protein
MNTSGMVRIQQEKNVIYDLVWDHDFYSVLVFLLLPMSLLQELLVMGCEMVVF